MSELKHAKLSASGSHRWLNCTASVKAEEPFPNSTSEYAEEGTLAHELADICLSNNKKASDYINTTIEAYSNDKLIDIVVDEDMARFVDVYIDYVKSFENEETKLYSETKVDFSNFVEDGFGTVDSAIVDFETGICHIFDLKYGQGIEVSAVENTQAMLYALGFFSELECLEVIKSFKLHIVQPRKFNISEWDINVVDLLNFGKYARKQSKIALSDQATFNAGEKQCKFCKAKHSCPALKEKTEATIKEDFKDLTKINYLTEDDLNYIMNNKKLIEDFLNAVEDRVKNLIIEEGKDIKDWKIVAGRSTTKWTDEAEEYLSKKYGDNVYEKKLIGITKAKKVVDKEDLEKLTFKSTGNETLAPKSDKRPALIKLKAEDYFEVIE